MGTSQPGNDVSTDLDSTESLTQQGLQPSSLLQNADAKERIKKIVHIRPTEPYDYPYIYSTWAKSMRSGHSYYRSIPDKIYREEIPIIIGQIIGQILEDATEGRICCLNENPDIILGYLIYKPSLSFTAPVCYWIYTRKQWRRQGIANFLLKRHGLLEAKTQFPFLTQLSQKIMPSHWQFNPFLQL